MDVYDTWMGIYARGDSPFWWMVFDGTRIRRSTMIPRDGGSPAQDQENERQAKALYAQGMVDIAMGKALDRQRAAHAPLLSSQEAPRSKSPSGWCYIYVVQNGQLVKIGQTVNVRSRLKALRTSNGGQITLLVAIEGHDIIEKAIHHHFRHLREEGEWFRITPELMNFVDRLKAGRNPIALLW